MRVLSRFALFLQIAALLGLAWAWPGIGLTLQKWFSLKEAAIVTIFLVTGLSLGTRPLLDALRQVRLHLTVGVILFVVFPLLVAATHFPFDALAHGQLTLGLFAMASLPTTVSSCVVFTLLAGGNGGAALFNAVVTNLVGLVVSPLIFLALIRTGNAQLSLDKRAILLSLGGQVLLPFALGHLSRLVIRAWVDARRPLCSRINATAILLIVYQAFCGAFGRGPAPFPLLYLVPLVLYLLLLHLAMLWLSYRAAGALGFATADRTAITFTASQKTLSLGLPLISAFCAGTPGLAVEVVLLPIIVYHPIQLIVASFVKDYLCARATPEP